MLFEEFTLEVLPPFPKTEHYTLRTSPKEVKVGEKSEVVIESIGEDKMEIDVQLKDRLGRIVEQKTFQRSGEFVDTATLMPLYTFGGIITFPKQGTWTLVIDGEKRSHLKINSSQLTSIMLYLKSDELICISRLTCLIAHMM
ncbi:hypothetical protein ACI2OX_09165 [Bacillus sp. N9]